MGLSRIFLGAVIGVLIPTLVVAYFAFAPAGPASARTRACEAAQGFVAKEVAPAKVVRFEACSDDKELELKDGSWQVLGDVEIDKGAGGTQHESYLVRLKLGGDGGSTLDRISLR